MLNPIRRIRLELGLQQFRVAALSGLHPTRLSLIETGRAAPRPAELERIASALGVPASLLSLPATQAAA